MSARRSKRISGQPKKLARVRLVIILIVFVCVLTLLIRLFAKDTYWSGSQKLAIAAQEESGDVSVLIFDPVTESITRIRIPGNTQVEVAGNLGVWKLKSVWDLGKNENLGGMLLAKTITKNFKFPLHLFSNESILDFLGSNPLKVAKAVFAPGETEVGLRDRFQIGLFTFGVKNANRIDIDLSKTLILRKTILADGTEGFMLSNLTSQNILAKFADHAIANRNYIFNIRDSTGLPGVSEKVGEIVEVLGGKVASIKKEDEKDITCQVWGKDKEMVKKVADILGCDINTSSFEGQFDLEILLGKKFVEQF